ncbi:hypothetical protein [Sporomusa sphaeroides]|uniref:Uncharacterized protein n=1 Tax=Sporomusa sphaeroides DSM 2875 TaxID=1337886 RepID=A0ABM9W8M6_9FIRM|nr:hypothetical protein [Sporomusa sphaeroides]OLS55609.1 hypothetical protein SPSPH_29380 [Sporomusa sphaeroides DSM 2875]CVK21458.1 hypothetical protein SSPH_04149 [Sporomusa sphaeroides DSM 2875]
MMLKTVYGPPPVDAERIEAAEAELESALVREEDLTAEAMTASLKRRTNANPDKEARAQDA